MFTLQRTFSVSRKSFLRLLIGSSFLTAPGFLAAQDIVPDGRSGTSLAGSAGIVDITTSTIQSNLGINSFSRLDVAAGVTVNIHAPLGTAGTINIVRDRASRIDGTLNGVMGGVVGGAFVLANPNGIVVGATGRVAGGEVTLTTPDSGIIDSFFAPDGTPRLDRVSALRDGTAPLSETGDIDVQGVVEGTSGVTIRAGRDVTVGNTSSAGRAAAVSAVANVAGRRQIVLDAGRNANLHGQVRAGKDTDGGSVSVRAGGNANITWQVDASAILDGAGGLIEIEGEGEAWIAPAASVLARGAGTGGGGSIRISGGSDGVRVQGTLSAARAAQGVAAGAVLITAPELDIASDIATAGDHLTLHAGQRIDLRPFVSISTRPVAAGADPHRTFSAMTGDAGDLALIAPVITIGDSAQLLAHGAGVFDGGALSLQAEAQVGRPGLFAVRASTQITLERASILMGDSVQITATSAAQLNATELLDLIDLGALGVPQDILPFATVLARDIIDRAVPEGWTVLPARVSSVAEITSSAARIEATSGNVTIAADATSDVTVSAVDAALGVVAIQSETRAEVALQSSAQFFVGIGEVPRLQQITASDTVRITSRTTENQNLTGYVVGSGTVPAFVLSDRVSRSAVTTPLTSRDRFGRSEVLLAGNVEIAAAAVRDLRLSAIALGGTSGAPAFVVSRQAGVTEVDFRGSVQSPDRVQMTAETLYRRLDLLARAQNAEPDPDGPIAANPVPSDAQALETAIRDLTNTLERFGDSRTAPGTIASAADLVVAATLLSHDDTTTVALDRATINVLSPDWFGDGPPPVTSPIVLDARTAFDRVSIVADADAGNASALAVNALGLGATTQARQSGVITTASDVNVSANLDLPGAEADLPDGLGLLGIGDGGDGYAPEAVLPAAASLLPEARGLVRALAKGTATAGPSLSATYLETDFTTQARSDVTELGVVGVQGFGYYDPISFAFIDPGAGAVRYDARMRGAFDIGSGSVDGGIGASVTVARLNAATQASAAGIVIAESLRSSARNESAVVVSAVSGLGSTLAVAVSEGTLRTEADMAMSTDLRLASDGAGLTIAAEDAARVITLAGLGTDGQARSVGASLAVSWLDRITTASFGEAFFSDYDVFDFYRDRPFIFDQAPIDFPELRPVSVASITARSSGATITAASAGAGSGGVPAASVARVANLALDALVESDVPGTDILEKVPSSLPVSLDAATVGLSLAGASAVTRGAQITTSYVGAARPLDSTGDLVIQSEDTSLTATLGGALVPISAGLGLGGGGAWSAFDRIAQTKVYGDALSSGGFLSITADDFSNEVVLASSGTSAFAAGAAGAVAVATGQRGARVRLGSVALSPEFGTIIAREAGHFTVAAGALRRDLLATVQSGGVGLAVAVDASERLAEVELARFVGRPEQDLLPPDSAIVLNVPVSAFSEGESTVLARSSVADAFGAAGSVAVRLGQTKARLHGTADLVGADGLRARAGGVSLARAGSLADGGQVAFGLATAVQAETRRAEIELSPEVLGGNRFNGTSLIEATVEGIQSAQAEGTAKTSDAIAAALNGSVAVNIAEQRADVSLRANEMLLRTLTLSAFVTEETSRSALAGYKAESGIGGGAGFGVAFDGGSARTSVTLDTGPFETAGIETLAVNSRVLGGIDVVARNGALAGLVTAGVNAAVTDATSSAEAVLRGTLIATGQTLIDVQDVPVVHAVAESLPDGSGGGTIADIAAGVAAVGLVSGADVLFDQTYLSAYLPDGITVTTRAAPIVSARSANVDAIGLDLDWAVIGPSGLPYLNLDLAASLAAVRPTATLMLDRAALVAGGDVNLQTEAFAEATIAGLVSAQTDVTLSDSVVTAHGGTVDIVSQATARALTGDAGTSARTAADRRDEERLAALAQEGADATRDPVLDIDIVPDAARAIANLTVLRSTLTADTIDLTADATTDVILTAPIAALSLAVAVTETRSSLIVEGARIVASDAIHANSVTQQIQSLAAGSRVGTGTAIASVLSLRRGETVLLIDTHNDDPTSATPAALIAPVIEAHAIATRDLDFSIIIEAGDDADAALGAVLALGDDIVSAVVGGQIGDAATERLSVMADVQDTLRVNAETFLGQLDPAPTASGLPGLSTMAAALRDIATLIEQDAAALASAAPAVNFLSDRPVALGLVALGQRDQITAQIGGARDSLVLGDTLVRAQDVELHANSTIEGALIRNRVALGLEPRAQTDADGNPVPDPVTAGVSLVARDSKVHATIASDAEVLSQSTDVQARTELAQTLVDLPIPALSDLASGSFASANDAPDLGDVTGDDWTLAQDVSAASTLSTAAIDAAGALVRVETVATLDGAVDALTFDLRAELTGGISVRAGGGQGQSAGMSGVGAGLAGIVLDETTKAQVGPTAQLVALMASASSPDRRASIHAESAPVLFAQGLAKGDSGQALNGGAAVLGGSREVIALIDPRAKIVSDTTLTARDSSARIADARAQAAAAGVAVGAGIALTLFETTIEAAVVARLEDEIILEPALLLEGAITLTAEDASLAAALATAGSEKAAGAKPEGYVLSAALRDLLAEVPDFEYRAALLDILGATPGYGLGVSGAVAGHFGTTHISALAEAADLRATVALSLTARDISRLVAASGGAVRGSRPRSLAGAASIIALDAHVTARAARLRDHLAALNVTATQNRNAAALSVSARGFSVSTLGAAGSAAVDFAQLVTRAEVEDAQIVSDFGVFYTGPVSVLAETGGNLTLRAGASNVGIGNNVGVSFAGLLGQSETRAQVLNAALLTSALTIDALTRRNTRAESYAEAFAPIVGLSNIAAAVTLDSSITRADAAIIGGRVVARDLLRAEARGGTVDASRGNTLLRAERVDLSTVAAATGGGAAIRIDGARTIRADATGTQLAVNEGPEGEVLTLAARDYGEDRATTVVASARISDALSATLNLTDLARRGEVAARLGQPAADGVVPTALAVIGADRLARVDAFDNRDMVALMPTLSLSLASGLGVSATTQRIDDTRATRAIARDALVFGEGGLKASAQRGGDLQVTSLIGEANALGAASVGGNIALLTSRSAIEARIEGTQLAFFGPFGGLEAVASDNGDMRASTLDLSYANIAIGVRFSQIDLERPVFASVGDSETRVMALPLTGDIVARATTLSTISAPAMVLTGGVTTTLDAIITSLNADRPVFAGVGGPIVARSANVTTTRDDTLRILDLAGAFSGASSIGFRLVNLRHGGATEAVARTSGATTLAGDLTVTAIDRSELAAGTLALSGSVSGIAGLGDVTIVRVSGGRDPDPGTGREALDTQARQVLQTEVIAANLLDTLNPPIEGPVNPLRRTAPGGRTEARVEGADLDPIFADNFGVLPESRRARIGGNVDVKAETDQSLGAVTGQVALAANVGVTAAANIVFRGTETRARIDTSGLTEGFVALGTFAARAVDIGETRALSYGVSVGGAGSGTASFVLARDTREITVDAVAARVTARRITLDADTDGNVIAVPFVVSGSGNIAAGVGIGIASDRRETRVLATDAQLVTTGSAAEDVLRLRAQAGGNVIAVGLAGAFGSGTAVGVAAGVATRNATTEVVATRATLSASQSVVLAARLIDWENGDGNTSVTAFAVPVAVSGGGASLGVGFAAATQSGATRVLLDAAQVTAARHVTLDAQANGTLASLGIGASSGGAGGAIGSFALSFRNDDVEARIRGGSLSADGSVLVLARAGSDFEGFAGADAVDAAVSGDSPASSVPTTLTNAGITIGAGVSFGIGLSFGDVLTQNTVTALIDGGANVTAHGRGAAILGPGRGLDVATLRGQTARRGVTVLAESRLKQFAASYTAGIGGTTGVALQVTQLDVRDIVTSRIGGEDGDETVVRTSEANAAVDVEAYGAAQYNVVNFSLGGGGTTGVGAVFNIHSLSREVTAEIRRADVTAAGDVRIEALLHEQSSSFDLAGGAGFYAGVAGAVMLQYAGNSVTARIADATVTAENDLHVTADVSRLASVITGGAGLGIGAGGGAVQVVSIADTVLAEIADAPGLPASAVRGRSVAVTAGGHSALDLSSALFAGGVGTLTGVVAVVMLDSDVRARVGQSASVEALHGDVDVTATTTVNPSDTRPDSAILTAGEVSINGFGYGATVAVLNAQAVTEAEIAASANVAAHTGAVRVQALTKRDLGIRGGAYGIGLGGNIRVLTVMGLLGASGDGADGQDLITDAGRNLSASDPLNDMARDSGSAFAPEGFGTVGGTIARDRAKQTGARLTQIGTGAPIAADADRTIARVGQNADVAARQIVVAARDGTRLDVRSGGIGVGGGGSAIAGISRARVNSALGAEILPGATLVATATGTEPAVSVSAELGRSDGRAGVNARSYAGSVGLVLGAASASDAGARVSRVVTAQLLAGATITSSGRVRIAAERTEDVRATSEGFAAGTIAASLMRARVSDMSRVEARMSGQISSADAMTVRAISRGTGLAFTDALALSLGFSGSAIQAELTETSVTQALVDGDITAGGLVSLEARNLRDAKADARGISGSALFSVGGTWADVTSARTVQAVVAAPAQIVSGAMAVIAAQTADVLALAKNGAGALGAGLAGSRAQAELSGNLRALVEADSVTIRGAATISAESAHIVTAEADSFALGLLVGVGSASARSEANVDTRAALVSDGRIGGTAKVAARTDELLDAVAEGAGGGAVGVLGAQTRVFGRSSTITDIGSRTRDGIDLAALSLTADHLTRYVPVARADRISALGLGEVRSDVDVSGDGAITVLANSVLRTGNAAIDAAARVNRVIVPRSALSGSGGGISETAARADHNAKNTASVTFGAGSRLIQAGAGGVSVEVAADVAVTPSVAISTREGVSGSRGQADATADNTARVVFEANATLQAQGALDIATVTGGRVLATVNTDTIAAASNILATAQTSYTARETVRLDADARIEAGRVAINTGGTNQRASLAEIGATATYRSTSVVPLDFRPRARVQSVLHSTIDIATRAQIVSGGALALGTQAIAADAQALARGRNLWTQTADSILDFLGGEQDIDVDGIESVSIDDDTGVTLNGVLESGKLASRRLIYDASGVFRDPVTNDVINPEDIGVGVTVSTATAAQVEAEVLGNLTAQRATYAAQGRDDLVYLLDMQIAEVSALLAGLAARAPAGDIEVVRFDDISMDGADILIAGGYLRGNGTVRPTAAIGVDLDIRRPDAVVVLGSIRVPDQPGALVLNGLRVGSNAAVMSVNTQTQRRARVDRQYQATPNPQILTPVLSTPSLTFVSAAQTGGGRVRASAVGDLYASGAILNRAGTVDLSSLTNLLVQGNITAQQVILTAPNVIVGLIPGLRHVAGDPQAILFDRPVRSLIDNELGNLAAVFTGYTPADLRQSAPAILAQNVSIYSETVNVNGRIEVGGPELSVVIGAGADAWINTGILPAIDSVDSARVLVHNPLRPDAQTAITGNVPVYYNPATDRIEFDPIVAQGGNLRIAGRVISTGNGEIVVLDGFARINVTSASTRTLQFDTVDTGGATGVAGRAEFIDLRQNIRTVFAGVDTPLGSGAMRRDIQRQTFSLPLGSAGAASAGQGVLVASSTIAAQLNGRREVSYQIAPVSGLVPVISYRIDATHAGIATAQQNRSVGAPVVVESAAQATPFYSYSRSQATIPQNGVVFHTHRFRADEPIAIEFRGERTGQLSITAAGAVELTGLLRSEGAGLAITAGGAIVGRGPDAELRGAQIRLETTSAASISGGAVQTGVTQFVLNGAQVTPSTLFGSGLDLGALFASGALVAQAPVQVTGFTSIFRGLVTRPVQPDAPLSVNVTSPRNSLAAGVVALTGTAAGGQRGNVSLQQASGTLPITQIDGRAVSIVAEGAILRAGGNQGAGLSGLEVRATDGITLRSQTGAIGAPFAIRLDPGRGSLRASAQGDVNIAHDPNAAFATGTLRLDLIESLGGSVVLTSQGRILDANGEGFENRVTEEAAIADFWTEAGLLGPERQARIDAELDARRAEQQQNFELYWRAREQNGGNDLSKEQLATLEDAARDAAQAAGLTTAEAEAVAERVIAAYEIGRELSNAIDPAASVRPEFEAQLTPQERNAVAAELTLTPEQLDLGLRGDWVVPTTDTEITVERPNISAAQNITLRAASVGEDVLVARLLRADSAPVAAQPGVTDYLLTDSVPRDLLVLLATSERESLVRRGFPSSRIDIFRAQDVDLSAGGVVNVLLHTPLPTSYDASAYIGSEQSLTLNQIAARERARVKVGGSVLAAGANAPGVQAAAIILEAAAGRVGTAAAPITLRGTSPTSAITLDARAGGSTSEAGDIHLRRVLEQSGATGDLVVGGVNARDSVQIAAQAGSILAAPAAGVLEGGTVSLSASGSIGAPIAQGSIARRALRVITTGPLSAEAGTGLFLQSPQSLTARSIGATLGRVEIEVTAGDLVLQGATADPQDATTLQIAPAIYALTGPASGISTGPNDIILNVQNGRVLDRGSDRATAGPRPFIVPDIRGTGLRLFTGGFGEAANPVELDVAVVSGNASAGFHAALDRRQQPETNRRLLLGGLTAPQGSISISSADEIALASGVSLQARDTIELRGLNGSAPISLLGDASLQASTVRIDTPFADLALTLDQTGRGKNLSVAGDLSIMARRVSVGGLEAPFSVFNAGTISATGDLGITVTEGAVLRQVSGRNVIVAASASELAGGRFGVPADVAVRQITARANVDVSATGNLRVDQTTAAGDAVLRAGPGLDYASLRVTDVTAGGSVTLAGSGLDPVAAGLIRVDAARLTGSVGDLPAGVTLRLGRQTLVEDFSFGTPVGVPLRLQALAAPVTFAGSVVLAPARIEALEMTIAGSLSSGALDIAAINGLSMSANAHLQGDTVAVAVGGPLGSDFVERPARLVMAASARMTAQGKLTLSATEEARITGLASRLATPGATGIEVSAARITEAGDAWIDLTTPDTVVARLRASELAVDAATGLETQVGALDIVVGRGDILVREADDLIIRQGVTGRGRIDIFGFGDIQLASRQSGPVLGADGSLIVTASGSLFTTGGAVSVSAPELYLGAIDGSAGTQASRLELVVDGQAPDLFSVFAGRHIVGDFALGPVTVPLLAADTGLIDVRFLQPAIPHIVSAAGMIQVDGMQPLRPFVGIYDTRPPVSVVLESARYPLRQTRGGDGAQFEPAGLTALPGEALSVRRTATDGAIPQPGLSLLPSLPNGGSSEPVRDQVLSDRAKAIAASARNGQSLPGAPATSADNPLQPFGTEQNRSRLWSRVAAQDEDNRRSRVNVDPSLRN